MLSNLRFRIRTLFRAGRVEAELEDELRFHLGKEVEKNRKAGLPEGEAVGRARLAFGGLDQVKEDCRRARGTGFVEDLLQDVRYGLRAILRNPTFFGIAALTLALGIGASTAIFSLVNTILLRPLPYPNADRIVMLWRKGPLSVVGSDVFPWNPRELRILLQTSTSFQNVGAFKKDSFNLTGADTPELLEGVRANAGLFRALGVSAILGRSFSDEDDSPGHDNVAVLSNRLWRTRFAGDTGVIGKNINLNGSSYTVIGVMPATFTFPNTDGIPADALDLPKETQLWVPLALPMAFPIGGPNELGVIAELTAGMTPARVQQDLAVFEKRLEDQIPQEKNWSSPFVPLGSQTISDSRRPLLLLLGAVTTVLLIACSNVAGLTLNRALARRRELTLRSALGARRGRVLRQLMTESLLLAMAGGLIGIALGEAGLFVVKRFGPDTIPHLHETGLDFHVMAYALGLTLITGVLFGLVPALGATRLNMAEALRENSQRSGGNAAAPKIRSTLLIAQIGLALVLVIAAGLLVRTFYAMLHSNPGFDATRVITFELPLPRPKYSDTERMAQAYKEILLRLQSIPGVQSAGIASVVPMGGAPDGTGIRIPEHPTLHDCDAPYANYSFISPGYFASIGAQLLRGRGVTDADTLQGVPVTIINSTMAKQYFPGENPLGKQVGVGLTRFPARTIIGLVADIKHGSLRDPAAPEMFVPYTQNEIKIWPSMQTMQYAVRTKADPASVAISIQEAVHSFDPDLPVAKLATLTTLVSNSMTADRLSMLLVGSFGIFSLILASIGMYGVVSYSVMQRTAEIGVRIALGATRGQIFVMIISQAARLACAGIVIGLIAALASTHLMARFLYGVGAADPLTFALVALVLIIIALVACYIPARKAMNVEPVLALRYE
jgi:predicted permease